MAVTQMNVRLPSQLKEAGDETFASLGWSATQAVRTLWEFASRHASNPSVVKDALQKQDEDNIAARKELVEQVRAGRRIFPDFCKAHGVPLPEMRDDDISSYKETLAELYYEREMGRELV